MTRRLTLTSERLTELTEVDLAAVGGGYQLPTLRACLTGVYPTLDRPCPTQETCFDIEHTPLCPTTL